MSGYFRVLIADDDLLARERLAAAVEGERDMVVVARASSGTQAVAQCLLGQPDIVLIDLQIPAADGPAIMSTIISSAPDTIIIHLTTSGLDLTFDPLEAGARACLSKDAPRQEAIDVIRSAAEGFQKTRYQSAA